MKLSTSYNPYKKLSLCDLHKGRLPSGFSSLAVTDCGSAIVTITVIYTYIYIYLISA